jgi:hypothetical protein
VLNCPPVVDRRSAFNEGQINVLRWIADGCPDGVMEGYTYKTTALALETRRLVTVSKKGGVWRAEATDAGRYYLAHGTYPTMPSTTGAADATKPPASRRKRQESSAATAGTLTASCVVQGAAREGQAPAGHGAVGRGRHRRRRDASHRHDR